MKNILNYFVMFLKKIYFAPLRILCPFIKSFVNPFVDLLQHFFDGLFNSFSTIYNLCYLS